MGSLPLDVDYKANTAAIMFVLRIIQALLSAGLQYLCALLVFLYYYHYREIPS